MTAIKKEIEEMAGIVCNNAGAYICMGAMYKGENYTAKEEEINLKVATALYEAGYRKQSETVKEFAEKVTELDGHIRECCMQSFCDMVDIIAAEFGVEEAEKNEQRAKKDIKQAWQNGYNKAREEVVKEFAEKLKTELFANCVIIQSISNPQKEDMDSSEAFQIINELVEQFGKEE